MLEQKQKSYHANVLILLCDRWTCICVNQSDWMLSMTCGWEQKCVRNDGIHVKNLKEISYNVRSRR
jgi:hypothetical protein